jgi:uncharacterized protein YxjI
MPYCQSCGKEISPDATFCTYCGSQTGLAQQQQQQFQQQSTVPIQTGMQFSSGAGLLEINDIVMKKKILSMREHYDFEDTQGHKLGEGDGNFFQLPAKFHVLDNSKNPLFSVEGKLVSIRRQFNFRDAQGNQLGEIKKKLVKLIGSEYWVEQNGVQFLRIYGNFFEHDYMFATNGQPVAQVHKKWVAIRDSFGISITGNVDRRIVLGSVIAIEHEEVSEKHKNSGFF